MTENLIRQLMAAGLTKQQATSVTTEKLIQVFMKEDGKILISEAKRQVDEMRSLLASLKQDYYDLKKELENVSKSILGVREAQEQYGEINDEKAKDVVALYSALIAVSQNAGASASESVNSASFTMYAFLGGQAKREITFSPATGINEELSPKAMKRRL